MERYPYYKFKGMEIVTREQFMPYVTTKIEVPIVSVSGGADSTGLYLTAMEYFGNNFVPIYADTEHEAKVTPNYVRNLHVMSGGPKVVIVKADFSHVLERKRRRMLMQDARNADTVDDVRKIYQRSFKMRPSGSVFLDMMLWKGRAPSTKAQFCTEHLKLWPIKFWLEKNYPRDQYEWVMFSGIRAGESKRRASMQPFMWNDFFDCLSVLPMLYETKETMFLIMEARGVPPNPLYALGNSRVGCYPCIHAIKTELAELPDWVWDKLAYWESVIGRSWFPSGILPGAPDGYVPSVAEVRDWCKTSHGGRQFDIFKSADKQDAPSCMSGWYECE